MPTHATELLTDTGTERRDVSTKGLSRSTTRSLARRNGCLRVLCLSPGLRHWRECHWEDPGSLGLVSRNLAHIHNGQVHSWRLPPFALFLHQTSARPVPRTDPWASPGHARSQTWWTKSPPRRAVRAVRCSPTAPSGGSGAVWGGFGSVPPGKTGDKGSPVVGLHSGGNEVRHRSKGSRSTMHHTISMLKLTH